MNSIEDRFKRDFDTVALSIPQVDRGRGNPRNILGLVIYHDLDNRPLQNRCQSRSPEGKLFTQPV